MGTPEIALRCTDPQGKGKECEHYEAEREFCGDLLNPISLFCKHMETPARFCTHERARQAAIRDAVLTALEGMLGLAPKFETRLIESKEANTCSSPDGFGDAVLHRLWTQAVGTPGYDKAAWQQLGQLVYAGIAAGKKEKP